MYPIHCINTELKRIVSDAQKMHISYVLAYHLVLHKTAFDVFQYTLLQYLICCMQYGQSAQIESKTIDKSLLYAMCRSFSLGCGCNLQHATLTDWCFNIC